MNTLSFAKGFMFGRNSPEQYNQEDLIQNTVELQKHQAYENGLVQHDNSIFDINGDENFNQLKSHLSPLEKKYFNDLVNVKDDETREMIYERASERMKIIFDTIWNKQKAYVGLDKDAEQEYELDVMELDENYFDSSYLNNNLAFQNIRKQAGFKTNRYEDISLAHNVSKDSLKNNMHYIQQAMAIKGRKVKKQTVLSTIFSLDATFLYNKENS